MFNRFVNGDFARALTAEEQRAVAEGLSEKELALFDILTKPEPVLTKAEETEVMDFPRFCGRFSAWFSSGFSGDLSCGIGM